MFNVSPRYAPLAEWLRWHTGQARLTFAEVEEIIERRLPASARKHQAWWSNSLSHVQATAWMIAGWEVESADLTNERVSFRQVRQTPGTVALPQDRAGSFPRSRQARVSRPAGTGTSLEGLERGRTVVLVACSSTKLRRPAFAQELYVSDLFVKSRRFARQIGREWFILSAKHGLVHPNQRLEPYDLTLKDQPRAYRSDWARGVHSKLMPYLRAGDTVVFLAGATYRDELQPLLEAAGYATTAPLDGKRIGEQLQWLTATR